MSIDFFITLIMYLICAVCLVAQSRPTLWDPMDWSLPDSSVHGNSPGKNSGVDCHALLQGIFPTQGWNPGLPHCRQIIYCLGHQESPCIWYIEGKIGTLKILSVFLITSCWFLKFLTFVIFKLFKHAHFLFSSFYFLQILEDNLVPSPRWFLFMTFPCMFYNFRLWVHVWYGINYGNPAWP